MSSRRAFFGAAIAAFALLICIGAALVITTAMAQDASTDTGTDNAIQEISEEPDASDGSTAMASGPGSAQQVSEQSAQLQESSQEGSYEQNAGDAAGSAAGNIRCTIAIDCSTALADSEHLSDRILQSLPSNGLLLAPSPIDVAEGSTAFDVLMDACSRTGIPVDFTGGSFGSSVYVRSIGAIGEFDCGPQSGWTYTINGQTVFASASDRKMQAGDVLVWSYTCSLG